MKKVDLEQSKVRAKNKLFSEVISQHETPESHNQLALSRC